MADVVLAAGERNAGQKVNDPAAGNVDFRAAALHGGALDARLAQAHGWRLRRDRSVHRNRWMQRRAGLLPQLLHHPRLVVSNSPKLGRHADRARRGRQTPSAMHSLKLVARARIADGLVEIPRGKEIREESLGLNHVS